MNHPSSRILYWWLILLASSLLIPTKAATQPFPRVPVENGDQILFLGDSITQAGLYSAFIQTWLWAQYPDLKLDIINLGLNGETASGNSEKDHPYPRAHIHERIDRILQASNPDLVFICYGMNDGIYHPFSEQRFSDYQNGINRLLDKLEKPGRKIVLMGPPPFDLFTFRQHHPVAPQDAGDDFPFSYKTPARNYDQVLERYSQWIVAQKNRVAATIDLHTPLTRLIKSRRATKPEYPFGDGIHPPVEGHLEMALTILDTLGADRKKTDLQLKHLTHINSSQAPSPLWKTIQKRHRLLTIAWIEEVGHMKPNKAKTPSLPDAQKQAAVMEVEIRQKLSEGKGK